MNENGNGIRIENSALIATETEETYFTLPLERESFVSTTDHSALGLWTRRSPQV